MLLVGCAHFPLSGAVLGELAESFPQIRSAAVSFRPSRLPGGDESAAWRLGGFVIRVGPSWRTAAEAEWSYEVAAAVTVQVPEAIAAIRSAAGTMVQVIEGRPCSVWPFVTGLAADRADPAHRGAAAALLARLHTALAGAVLAERPAHRWRWETGLTSLIRN